MRLSSTLPIGRARSDAGAALKYAEFFARAGNTLRQAEKLSCAARSLQKALPGLVAPDAKVVGREILAWRTQAQGLYLRMGDLLQAAREMSQIALLHEQSHELGIDPRTQPATSGLLQTALQARRKTIELIRRLPQPHHELAVQLTYAARTIRYLLDDRPGPDFSTLLDQMISFRVEAAGLFAAFGNVADAYFEHKLLVGLYMTKAETVSQAYLQACEAAEKALVFFSRGSVSDRKLFVLYGMAAKAYRQVARQAIGQVPPDMDRHVICRRKALEFDELARRA
jgi:hypothetical protein